MFQPLKYEKVPTFQELERFSNEIEADKTRTEDNKIKCREYIKYWAGRLQTCLYVQTN